MPAEDRPRRTRERRGPDPGRTARTTSGFLVSEVDYAADRRQGLHAHPGASVTLVLRGSVRERAGRREETGRPLSVVVKPVGVEHADHYGDRGLGTVQILLPRETEDEGRRAGADLGGWRWVHAGPATAPFLGVVRGLRAEPGDGVGLEWAVYDTLAALLADRGAAGHRDPPAWLARARQEIDDAPPASLTVEGVASEAGVHPVSLTRAFRNFYGLTTSRYLRRVRVRHAARLIAETGVPLARVAYASGFSDQSHLTRSVRAETGLTPGALRRVVRARSGA